MGEQHSPGQPLITIVGEKVSLGPPHKDLVPLMTRWDNDLELSILSGDPARPRTIEASEAEYARYIKDAQTSWVLFMIYERATLRPIGIAGLSGINLSHRIATYGISIGERDCWSKGYGTETTYFMLDYAFSVLALQNVMLNVHSFNERAIRTYLRVGFKVIGRRREAYRLGTQVHDSIFMDCLAPEFHSPLVPVLNQLQATAD